MLREDKLSLAHAKTCKFHYRHLVHTAHAAFSISWNWLKPVQRLPWLTPSRIQWEKCHCCSIALVHMDTLDFLSLILVGRKKERKKNLGIIRDIPQLDPVTFTHFHNIPASMITFTCWYPWHWWHSCASQNCVFVFTVSLQWVSLT